MDKIQINNIGSHDMVIQTLNLDGTAVAGTETPQGVVGGVAQSLAPGEEVTVLLEEDQQITIRCQDQA